MRYCEFHPEALEELESATDTMSLISTALARKYRRAMQQAIERIADMPFMYELDPETGCRMCLVSKYRYCIHYQVFEDEVVMIAVAHTSRRPDYWHHRLSDEPKA